MRLKFHFKEVSCSNRVLILSNNSFHDLFINSYVKKYGTFEQFRAQNYIHGERDSDQTCEVAHL